MQILRDKARELVGIAEGEFLKKEASIVALKRELARVKGDLAAKKDPRLVDRSSKCEGCAYKVIALKALEEEEKVREKWSIK